MTGARRLTTEETARRLGVKPETVYAYVSRGLLDSERAPGGRGSTFDPHEVEALVRRGRGRPGRAAPDGPGGSPGLPEIASALTLIEDGRFYYRGLEVVGLSARHRFEEVADWLWSDRPHPVPGEPFRSPDRLLELTRRSAAALPRSATPADRLRVAVAAAAAGDPLRFDLREETIPSVGRGLVALLVDSLPAAEPHEDPAAEPAAGDPAGQSLALRLWTRLSPAPPVPAAVRCLDGALVLLADHGLAASTLAARVAASVRAHPYAVVSAGLGAMDGPLHGRASGLAYQMLERVVRGQDAVAVVGGLLRDGRAVPGLGHPLYPDGDPRATALLARLADVPGSGPALRAVREVLDAVARHAPLPANCDLALAALALAGGMAPEAGEAVFAVARTAGWIAHAREEYRMRPLRLRPSGAYTGPRPASG